MQVPELASAYKRRYLHNSDYIAVMVRLKKAVVIQPLPLAKKKKKKNLQSLYICVHAWHWQLKIKRMIS